MLSQNAEKKQESAFAEHVRRERAAGRPHHAYLAAGEPIRVRPILGPWWEEIIGGPLSSSPDFWYQEFDSFSVDDSRDLRRFGAHGAFGRARVIAVAIGDSFNDHAQNALLKVLEEPISRTHLFIIVPEDVEVMGTLRSRCISLGSFRRELDPARGLAFLAKPFSAKMKSVESLKAMEARELLDDVEAAVAEEIRGGRPRPEAAAALRELSVAKGLLARPGASIKIVMGHIAAVVYSCI